jgi:hypothetical protein
VSTFAARLERIASDLSALAADLNYRGTGAPPAGPHPDTAYLLGTRGTVRRQIHLSVPEALDLPGRLAAYARDHGYTVTGDVAALAMDAFLRAEGYTPPPFVREPRR